mmetsp:Transcript_100635/g.178682  ORF Transcript_100635/g.178682 Transcript_100635/m.178682 type:complete len:244 (-) Transcript_100635:2401-3132(-)
MAANGSSTRHLQPTREGGSKLPTDLWITARRSCKLPDVSPRTVTFSSASTRGSRPPVCSSPKISFSNSGKLFKSPGDSCMLALCLEDGLGLSAEAGGLRCVVLETVFRDPGEPTFFPPSGLLMTFLARVAYLKDVNVSSQFELLGEQFTNIKVLAEPPNESCRISVSLWFRYGMIFCFVVKASMTSPSAVSDLLISIASFSLSPVDKDFLSRSDPARSTITILPCIFSSLVLLVLVSRMMHTR